MRASYNMLAISERVIKLRCFKDLFLCAVSEGSGNTATDTVGGTYSLHLVLIEQFHMEGSAALPNSHYGDCNVLQWPWTFV